MEKPIYDEHCQNNTYIMHLFSPKINILICLFNITKTSSCGWQTYITKNIDLALRPSSASRLFPTSASMIKWEVIYTHRGKLRLLPIICFFMVGTSSSSKSRAINMWKSSIALETKLWTNLSLLMSAIVRLNNLRIRNTKKISGLKWRGHSLHRTRGGRRQIGWLSQAMTEFWHRLWGPLDFSREPIKKGCSWGTKLTALFYVC